MSVEQVSSNVYGQLDAQIAQLIQCKPLPEQEVFFRFCHPICFSLLYFVCVPLFSFRRPWELSSLVRRKEL